MKKTKRAPIREAVLGVLMRNGPMAISDIAAELDWPRTMVEKAIVGTRYEYPGRHFRIVSYRWQEYGQGREIPLYSAEGGEDKPRPQATKARHLAQKRAYYHRHKARINAATRARRQGAAASVNPWLQLAPPEVRPVMTRGC
jgi:hypothetical protein